MDCKRAPMYSNTMHAARRSFSVLIASLVAIFGVATAAPVHAHALNQSQPHLLHLVAGSVDVDHGVSAYDHGHTHVDAFDHQDGGESAPLSDDEQGEPVLHAHGCAHVATVDDRLQVSYAGPVAAAVWFEVNSALASVTPSPPRKPPRAVL